MNNDDDTLCKHGRPVHQDCFACEAEYCKEVNEEQKELKSEQTRRDEQEALSLKYAKSLSILALSSGKFALFLPFSNETGMPLAKIDDWAGLEAEVRAWRDKEEPEAVTKRKVDDAINLVELFGEEQKENSCGN